MPFAWLGCNFSFYNFTLLDVDISYSSFINWVRKHSLYSLAWFAFHFSVSLGVSLVISPGLSTTSLFICVSRAVKLFMSVNLSFRFIFDFISSFLCLPAEILSTTFWTEAHPWESHYLRLSGFISIICYFSCFFLKKLHCPVSLWEGESF